VGVGTEHEKSTSPLLGPLRSHGQKQITGLGKPFSSPPKSPVTFTMSHDYRESLTGSASEYV
jgi:hypothetical protein